MADPVDTPADSKAADELFADELISDEGRDEPHSTSEGRTSASRGGLSSQSQQTEHFDTFDNDPVPSRHIGTDEAVGSGPEGTRRSRGQRTSGRESYRSTARRWIIAFRRKSGAIVNHPYVQLVIVMLIVTNAIMMGIGTFDFVTDDPHLDSVFQKVDRAFLVIFTIELAMQFIYRGLTLFRDGWLVFDLIIVVMSWSFESLQIIRAFRVFRALRLITRIKTLRNLVLSLLAVFPRLGAIGCLLLLIFYIFAVMFTTLFKDLELSYDYFSRLDNSLFTLFQLMTMEWSEVARECMEYYDWAWLPFIIFVALSGFIVFNLIIAVICDAVAVIEHENEQDDQVEVEEPSAFIDANSHRRISALQQQVASLLRTQKEMQLSLDFLAKEYYALQGVPPPPHLESPIIDSPIREDARLEGLKEEDS